MKKFIQKCFLAITIVILINLLSLVILLLFSPSLKKVYEFSGFTKKNYDLLVLGNSMAFDGIDAEYLSNKGISTYNFAINGCHISSCEIQLDTYLKHNTRPKAVLIGFSSATGRSLLNKKQFNNPEMEFFYQPTFTNSVLNPPVVKFRWLFAEILKIIVSKDHRNAKLIRGQWQTKKIIKDESVYKNSASHEIAYTNPFLLNIVKKCEKLDIKVIFVELPGANVNRNSLPYEYQIHLDKGYSKTMYNLNNYEVSNKIVNPSSDWLAHDHLNEFGAEKVTSFLYNHVIKKEMNLIPSTTINQ